MTASKTRFLGYDDNGIPGIKKMRNRSAMFAATVQNVGDQPGSLAALGMTTNKV